MSIKTRKKVTKIQELSKDQHLKQEAIIPPEFIEKKLSIKPSYFAFLAKGNNHCPS